MPDTGNVRPAIKTLLRTDLFSDAGLTLQDDGTLVVRVAENPIINRVVFEGNSALSDDQDANMAATLTTYSNEQTAFSAALKAGADIVQSSLMDFLST